jgi:outer membrane protein assembly factor BamB
MVSASAALILWQAGRAPGEEAATGTDWAEYRGPNRDGVSTESGWAATWPPGGPKVLWKTSVGVGYSSVSVSHGMVYTLGNARGKDTVYCFDAATGKTVWQYSYPCADGIQPGTRMTPTVDGDRVYIYSREGNLFCLDAAGGQVKWSKNVVEALKAKSPRYGYGCSPLVFGEMLILETGAEAGSIVALDKMSGKVLWQSGKETCGFTSPMVVRVGGRDRIVMFCGTALVGLDAKTGEQLWREPWEIIYPNTCATPVVAGTRVFISTGYKGGGQLFDIAEDKPRLLWKTDQMNNLFSTCVLWKGHLYGFDGDREGPAFLRCLDFETGSVKWSHEGLGKGTLMIADGKLIMMSDSGELVIAEATPDGYKELSRVKVLEGLCWTVPVLSHGRIYCRSLKGELVALDVHGQ